MEAITPSFLILTYSQQEFLVFVANSSLLKLSSISVSFANSQIHKHCWKLFFSDHPVAKSALWTARNQHHLWGLHCVVIQHDRLWSLTYCKIFKSSWMKTMLLPTTDLPSHPSSTSLFNRVDILLTRWWWNYIELPSECCTDRSLERGEKNGGWRGS